ncbi:MAG: hypothetical protein QOE78_1892, partial [Alphaproteobacteria bacterium]|nr:hypothetical protein [Alphaproteobacteria bacterium]
MHNHRPLVLDPSPTAAYHVTNQSGVETIGEKMCLTPRIEIFRPGKFLA